MTTKTRTAYYRSLTLDGDDPSMEGREVTFQDVFGALLKHFRWDALNIIAARAALKRGVAVYANGYFWHQQDETTTDDGPW